MSNTITMKVSGKSYTLAFDLTAWTGETLETVEDHLGGEPFMAWVTRLAEAFEQGIGVKQLRARDIIALVYLARATAEPGLAWTDVSRTIAPYTLEILDEDTAAAT